MLANLIMQQGGAKSKRKNRNPVFTLGGTIKPFGLYPMFIHPVLPGETLNSFTMKVHLASEPLKNPLNGAWWETWLFYVKLNDLGPDLVEMFIKDGVSTTGHTAGSSDQLFFTKSGQIDWVRKCTDLVHSHYFIHEDETARTINGVPQVKLNSKGWWQNLMQNDADAAVPTGDAADMYAHLQEFAILQQMGMQEMTYEKYLELFGGRAAAAGQGKPELLLYDQRWKKPANTINPADGTPSSAWVWNEETKLGSKNKRFNEPGFVIAFQTIRPKMFNGAVRTSLVGNMWGFKDWYPAYTLDDPTATVKTIANNDPVFEASAYTTGGTELIYDHSDLLAQGEQFINDYAPPYALPLSSGMVVEGGGTPESFRGEYCTSADVDALFQDGAKTRAFYDGIAFCNILGHVADNTPLK
ncbi:capsid protein [Ruegeria phage vB_RpoMi-V15]|nr:capsid protein [Ruegeria phage DSS3-P22]AWY08876.1 capsid protein [Ruegeria phage vB_RpoMi-V15]